MIKLVSDTIDKSDIDHLVKWLSPDDGSIPRLTKGNLTWELEEKWANKLGTKHSVFVNSGSSAILLTLSTLKEMGRLRNNKIVVPALSWLTDVSSPMVLGMDVSLCDCNLEDLSCDLTMLENLFKQEDPSVFISVCPLGLVPKMKELVDICEKYDVILLEDVCESMGSKYQDKYLGTFGKASFFSMYFGHHISTIEGGFINTDDTELYYGLLMMRSHGWDRDLPEEKREEMRKEVDVDEFKSLYTFHMPGYNLRSTDLQAFIGLRAIDKLDDFSNRRNENFNLYNSIIKNNKLNIKNRKEDFISNFAYPIIHSNRDKIVDHLRISNIEVRPLIAGNMANNPFWVKKYEYKELPNCELIDKEGFYIPNHQDLKQNEIEFISNIINKY